VQEVVEDEGIEVVGAVEKVMGKVVTEMEVEMISLPVVERMMGKVEVMERVMLGWHTLQ
jgi:hypothetical protein